MEITNDKSACAKFPVTRDIGTYRNVSDVEQPSETEIFGSRVYSGFSSAMISGKHRLSSQDEHLGTRNSVREDV